MHEIRHYDDTSDRLQVVELWQHIFGYETAHNEPNLSISKKSRSTMACFLSLLKTHKLLEQSWLVTMDTVDGCIRFQSIPISATMALVVRLSNMRNLPYRI